jgi:hypothetical protein
LREAIFEGKYLTDFDWGRSLMWILYREAVMMGVIDIKLPV